MTKDEGKSRKNEEFEDDVSRKMDGSMRRLLKKSDAEIRKEYNREKKRLAGERKRIEGEIPTLSATATSAATTGSATTMCGVCVEDGDCSNGHRMDAQPH